MTRLALSKNVVLAAIILASCVSTETQAQSGAEPSSGPSAVSPAPDLYGGWLASDLYEKSCFHDHSCHVCEKDVSNIVHPGKPIHVICQEDADKPAEMLKQRISRICPNLRCDTSWLETYLVRYGFNIDGSRKPGVGLVVMRLHGLCPSETRVYWDIKDGLTTNLSTKFSPGC